MAKKKVKAKKKVAKKVVKKPVKKAVRKVPVRKVSRVVRSKQRPSSGRAGWGFLRLLFIVLLIFGGYRAWVVDWTQGVYIIGGAIVIWLIVELFKALKK
ncbi:hypothetical protein CMI46_01930 [Candidatus Pacearchaeota archaeon]|nr:hypothetical protein [Candidatus Pacearchaeota archaeon]|tara:strand:- start:7863 stop:8159 length:297 start_codon:yes stop_codon:yes gene_type:complete